MCDVSCTTFDKKLCTTQGSWFNVETPILLKWQMLRHETGVETPSVETGKDKRGVETVTYETDT